ncbi:MAG: hypothetical protein FJ265_06005 [Planctomycetes bacterium]|nr:hypothetical protein [Planctomycetota bacterium]
MSRACLAIPVLVLLAACSRADGPRDEVLAAATIGPAGGQLEITEGLYAGTRLVVPGGALARAERITMVKPAPPPANSYAPAVVSGPGPYLRVDPPEVGFAVPASLRLPYLVPSVQGYGSGNVRVLHVAAAQHHYIEPPVVDAVAGRVEFPTNALGGYQVVPGVRAATIGDYLGALGATVPLEGGWSFTYEQQLLAQQPSFVSMQWRIDTGSFAEAVYLDAVTWRCAARAALSADWLEVWDTPLDVLLLEPYVTTPPVETTTRIHSPIASAVPAHTGRATLLARFGYELPLRFGAREFRDVLRVRLLVAWERPDLGTGSREQTFWFAPGVGLLQLRQDGLIRQRTDL